MEHDQLYSADPDFIEIVESQPAGVNTAMPRPPSALEAYQSTHQSTPARSWQRPESTPQPPVQLREIVAVLLLVALCDITIYRGYGFAGYALLFVLAPVLIFIGSFRRDRSWQLWTISGMLAVVAIKLLWQGSLLLVSSGVVLLIAFSMSAAGQRPFLLEVIVFGSQTIRAGFDGLAHYGRNLKQIGAPLLNIPWLGVILPAAAFVVFGMIFVLANPNLVASFSEGAEMVFRRLSDWLIHFSFFEIVFWIAIGWISIGLLRPAVVRATNDFGLDRDPPANSKLAGRADLYVAYRNTLVTVIGLFAVYLVFEFATLWFREFPPGFYYAGYAHEGAAWLTVALAMATVVLSLVFRGRILRDLRLPNLRKLAWIWSIQNFILALAVYNRLFIYIGFNGMTRMRMIGLFGITTVVVGFGFVLWKITRDRDFTWLLRRHLLTLGAAVYLFAVTPIDMIVYRYNVSQILAGNLTASVQITEHPLSDEAILQLRPLLQCQDPIIRDGIRAMLAERQATVESRVQRDNRDGWTTYQTSRRSVLEQLRAASPNWSDYSIDHSQRDAARTRFRDYAYQWY